MLWFLRRQRTRIRLYLLSALDKGRVMCAPWISASGFLPPGRSTRFASITVSRGYSRRCRRDMHPLLAMFEFSPSAVSPTTASADFPASIPPPCDVGSHKHCQGSPRVSHMRFQPYPSDLRLDHVRRSMGLATSCSLSRSRRLASASCSSDGYLLSASFISLLPP